MSNMRKHLKSDIKAPKNTRVALAVSDYNTDITGALLESCRQELLLRDVSATHIHIAHVPGAFELPFACKCLAESKKYDVIIALGAIIRGETSHFDVIAFASANGIMEVNIKYDIPVVFGVLTTENLKQAKERIRGGKRGDKGIEAALTALKMLYLKKLI